MDNKPNNKKLLVLVFGALGVVFGDIGTSPLYTIKQCFLPMYGLSLTQDNILGILSLIFWSLTLVIIVKYTIFVIKADNQGEGGIMALMALIFSSDSKKKSKIPLKTTLIILGLFGTALLLADGIITPAISVLSAVEGLEVYTPMFGPYIIPITLIILLGLFLIQKHGTGSIGRVFGPCLLVWFLIIGMVGLIWIIRAPEVLKAVNPLYALKFFMTNHYRAFHVLTAVILCFTGGEALYADIGHFGKRPIRFAFYWLVFPSLILNYFGQGASIILYGQKAAVNPFYFLSQGWLLLPMVILATIATIIASQALISGAFSLAQQAMQLGYIQRLKVIHTSKDLQGQIYIPEINTFLMISCLLLVLFFKNSSNLASAYGMAVMGTMTITTILLYSVAIHKWHWNRLKAGLLIGFFLIIDLAFLTANFTKLFTGGYVPLLIACCIYILMSTWKQAQDELNKNLSGSNIPNTLFMEDIARNKNIKIRIDGTAAFLTAKPDSIPHVLLHHLKHNKYLHERVILLSIVNEKIPRVPNKKKIKIADLGYGFYQVSAHYGFMESPDVPEIFALCRKKRLTMDVQTTSFYLGRVSLLTTGRSKMAKWRKLLYSFLSRNAHSTALFFNIPPNRVLELGVQIEL